MIGLRVLGWHVLAGVSQEGAHCCGVVCRQAKFPDLVSLLDHANSSQDSVNSNKNPEHHGFGRAVAYLLGLSAGGIAVAGTTSEVCEPKLEEQNDNCAEQVASLKELLSVLVSMSDVLGLSCLFISS